MDDAHGPAPLTIAVLRLSMRITAATPPSRRSAWLWASSHASRSSRIDQTQASLRDQDSAIENACRSTSSSRIRIPGNSAQSTCACAPGGVSTRRRARSRGRG